MRGDQKDKDFVEQCALESSPKIVLIQSGLLLNTAKASKNI